MPRFEQKFIEELLSKINIVDIIGGYCQLNRRGGSYWACCPLPGHSERTPSFAVNEMGQFYKCFGCGRGGDAIKFIMEMESLDFGDAVTFLCEKAHIPLPEPEKDFKSEFNTNRKYADKNRLYALMRESALFYVKTLSTVQGEKHRDYIAKRKLEKGQVIAFGLGASPDYSSLVNHLSKLGYTNDEMVASGAVQYSKERGNYFDALAGRLIFPIIDHMNRVIAFGGRFLEKTDFAKYKNTGDTPLFNKRKTLYNVNNLKKERAKLGKLDYVIMVEGYMDTIALHKAGFRNVVASMGTSLTVEQARLVKRYSDTVLICYDGDAAGQGATIRGLEILKANGLEVRIVSMPDGLDPDELISQRGAKAYQKCLDEALPLIDFKMKLARESSDLKSLSGKRKYIEESLKIISECENESLQEELLKKLRDESGLTYESLRRDLEKIKGGAEITVTVEQPTALHFSSTKTEMAERYILCAYLNGESYAKEQIEEYLFTNKFREELAQLINANLMLNKSIEQDKLKDFAGEDNLEELLKIMSAYDDVAHGAKQRFFEDCKKTLVSNRLKIRIQEIKMAFEQEEDREKRMQLAKELNELTMKLTKLK